MKFAVVLVVIVTQMTLVFKINALPVHQEDYKLTDMVGNDVETESMDKKAVEERQVGTNEYYIGCFKDDAFRHFERLSKFGYLTTLAACRNYCSGYKFVALQATDWCLCGNTLYKEGYPLVADSECNLPCKGESSRMCGAHWRNSIYLVAVKSSMLRNPTLHSQWKTAPSLQLIV